MYGGSGELIIVRWQFFVFTADGARLIKNVQFSEKFGMAINQMLPLFYFILNRKAYDIIILVTKVYYYRGNDIGKISKG